MDISDKLKELVEIYSKALCLPKKFYVYHNKGLAIVQKKKIYESISCLDHLYPLIKTSKAWYNKGKCMEVQ